MSGGIRVYKNRTTVIEFDLGQDISNDTLTSEIRSQPNLSGAYIAEWTIGYVTDGTDGLITLTIDDSIAANIQATSGYTDIRREVFGSGVPIPVFNEPVAVEFIGVVTE